MCSAFFGSVSTVRDRTITRIILRFCIAGGKRGCLEGSLFFLEMVVRGRRGECVKGLTAEMMFAPRRLRRRVVVAGNFILKVEMG